ncbi:MAG: division/cell wall cluster transcriptional repressor MraZ [Pirellulaceae bacterium]|nr:division/cell wall cluster transcriptional repressor MraZ [Pirellulaceae bacterium]
MLGRYWESVGVSGNQMLLTGTFPRTIDEKQRIAIPKRLRDAFQQTAETQAVIYVAPGTDGSLTLYTEESFSQLAKQLSASPQTGQDVRAFSRLFYSQAQRIELDRQGRLRIPPELVELAGLAKEVVLVGVRDHLELWDRQGWQTYVLEKQNNYDRLAENAFMPPNRKES